MIQPRIFPTLIHDKFFRVAIILSFLMLALYIAFIFLSAKYCGGKCFYNEYYVFPCVESGTLYCCSLDAYSGKSQCGWYQDCTIDNYDCGSYSAASWAFGSLLLVGLFLMIVASCRYKNKKRAFLMQAAYQNMNNPNFNQPYYAPYAGAPVQGYNQPVHNYAQPNQGYPNQGYGQVNQEVVHPHQYVAPSVQNNIQ